MKKIKLSRCALALLTILTFEATAQESPTLALMDIDLVQLGQLEVYTANRELSTIEKATSVITVITAEDIKKQGFKNIRDVLDRVAGFFNTPDHSLSLISNRGYAQNPNNNYLLLIDGHSINDQSAYGIGNMHVMPMLYQVKRIEILRGPGSTMWGADAGNGIIHLITYDGDELTKNGEPFIQVNADYEFERKRNITNALLGTKLGKNASLMFSATRAESKNAAADEYFARSTGVEPHANGAQYLFEQYHPSHELHSKIKWNDFSFDARSVRFASHSAFQGKSGDDDVRNHDFDYLRLGYNTKLSSNISFESNIYHNDVKGSAEIKDAAPSPDEWYRYSYDESGFTSILSYKGDEHRLKGGIQYQRRDFEPRINDGNIGSSSGIENSTGVFIEDEYSGIEDWYFTVGLRYQKSDMRQASEDLLPRVAAIWDYNSQWTFKYLYNTGVVPMTLNRSRGTLDDPLITPTETHAGPSDPQYITSHDLQVLYIDDRNRFSVTLYQTTVDGFIARATSEKDTGLKAVDGSTIKMRETNLADLKAYGIEIEGEHQLNEKWNFYGNYSWTRNKTDQLTGTISGTALSYDLVNDSSYFDEDGRMTGAPEHIWNLGFNYSPKSYYNINAHYRGWSGNVGKVRTTPSEFKTYGPEHYFDVTLVCQDCVKENLSLSMYAKNLFNNRAAIPNSPHGGYVEGLGREFGISASYKF